MKPALTLTKMSGAGNDFLIIDLRVDIEVQAYELKLAHTPRPQLAQQFCHRSTGKLSGADGLVFLLPSKDPESADFSWDFYNADGSAAEMCGNAARCVAQYAYEKGLKKDRLTFETKAGLIVAEVLNNNQVDIEMPPLMEAKWDQVITVEDQLIHYDFLNSGVPHVVIEQPLLDDKAHLLSLARYLRDHPLFQPAGTNVTFYHFLGSGHIQGLSYERGVEDFTKACGTGAVAAAAAYQNKHPSVSEIKVEVPGGQLEVHLQKDSRPHLIGPVRWISEECLEQI